MRDRLLGAASVVAIAASLLATSTAQGGPGARGTAASDDLIAKIKERGTLVVATNPQYPPASFLDRSGKWKGFDIDVATMIARALGVKVRFLTPAWDVMTAGHWSGRWDVAVGSMNPIPSRQKVLRFVDPPYYYLPTVVAVHADAPYTSLTELTGKTIGANRGTTYQLYVDGKLVLPNVPYSGKGHKVKPVFKAKFKGYDTDTNALQDLSLGDGVRLDAAIAAPTVIQAAIKNGLELRILGKPIFYEGPAIAADRTENSASLVRFIGALVKKWQANRTMSKLALRWFHVDYSKPQ